MCTYWPQGPRTALIRGQVCVGKSDQVHRLVAEVKGNYGI